MTLFLASQSPRRSEILRAAGVPFEVITNQLDDEYLNPKLPITEAVASLALSKAQASRMGRDGYVLGVDTVVVLDEQVLGKPRHYVDAANMLRRLNGRSHRVITGVGLVGTGTFEGLIYADFDEVLVTIKALSDDEINAYSHREFVLDKAGGYAIQDYQYSIVLACDGDRNTVMGLPIQLLLPIFKRCAII